MLRRRFDPWVALLLTLPHRREPELGAQLRALSAAAGVADARDRGVLGDRRGGARRATLEREGEGGWRAGGLLSTLAVSADPYPMLLLPLVGSLRGAWSPGTATGCAAVREARLGVRRRLHRRGSCRSSSSIASRAPRAGPWASRPAMLAHHWRLLVDECLPWALSYKVYFAHDVMDYRAWDAPAWFRALGIVGALLLARVSSLYGLASPYAATLPANVRRLGFIGALAFPLAIAAFLVSVMVMDHFSMRYLAVLTLMTPFAVAPAAHALGARRFAASSRRTSSRRRSPGGSATGRSSAGRSPSRRRPSCATTTRSSRCCARAGSATRPPTTGPRIASRSCSASSIVVVPTNAGEDRHAPYRRAFEAAPVFAYVHDPGRSREDLAAAERDLSATNAQRREADGRQAHGLHRPPLSRSVEPGS